MLVAHVRLSSVRLLFVYGERKISKKDKSAWRNLLYAPMRDQLNKPEKTIPRRQLYVYRLFLRRSFICSRCSFWFSLKMAYCSLDRMFFISLSRVALKSLNVLYLSSRDPFDFFSFDKPSRYFMLISSTCGFCSSVRLSSSMFA